MDKERAASSDVAFSPSVKAVQARKGSRRGYANLEARGGWETTIPPDLATFIEAQISIFLGTASADGQPYIQHRGGPPGFLKVLDDKTIGFADFSGNKQYITLGNLADNPKAHPVPHRLCAASAREDLGRGARGRRRRRAGGKLMPDRLPRAARAGDLVHGVGVGCQLPAAHSSALRGRGCRRRRWPNATRASPRSKPRCQLLARRRRLLRDSPLSIVSNYSSRLTIAGIDASCHNRLIAGVAFAETAIYCSEASPLRGSQP